MFFFFLYLAAITSASLKALKKEERDLQAKLLANQKKRKSLCVDSVPLKISKKISQNDLDDIENQENALFNENYDEIFSQQLIKEKSLSNINASQSETTLTQDALSLTLENNSQNTVKIINEAEANNDSSIEFDKIVIKIEPID